MDLDIGILKRREFLEKTFKSAFAAALFHGVQNLSFGSPSRIVEMYHQEATKGASLNSNVVRAMVDQGIKAFTGRETVGEAWKSLFPGLTETSKISIKINCISSSFSDLMVHKTVVDFVTAGLLKMQVGGFGFNPENITIWDMNEYHLTNAGFEINNSGVGIQCVACNSEGVGYDFSYKINVSGKTRYPCKILTKRCDYLINIGLIKDHDIAGGTFTLKNNFGSIDEPWDLHVLGCDPYAATLNADPLFKNKTVLLMLDSLFGVYSGGPTCPPQVVYNTIHFSKDTVAIDSCARDILNNTRKNKGLGLVNVPYIETAESIGLGSTEYSVEKFIPDEIVEHENPDDKEGNGLRTQEAFLYQNSPNPFNPETAVEFNIAGSSTQRIPVRLCVYDLNGINVKTLISDELKPGTHKISWHGDNNAGEKVASGIYTAFLEASGKRQGIKMILLK